MKKQQSRIFDESAWCNIEQLLPSDEYIKKTVLDDFIWFMRRPVKYKCNLQKIEDYIHHLKLKSNSKIVNRQQFMDVFKSLDIEKIKTCLLNIYI